MGEYNGINTEEYEKIIRNKLSKVLSYIAEYGMDSSYTKAKIDDLYQDVQGYNLSINKKRYMEDYPYEMWQAYNQCINNFDPDAGDFIHYYNYTLSHMCGEAKSINDGERVRQGICGISPTMYKRCKRIRQYCDENGILEPSQKDIRSISEIYGNGTKKDIYKWFEAYQMFKNTYVTSPSNRDDDDDEWNSFDAYSYRKSEKYSNQGDDEDEILNYDYDSYSSYSYSDDGEIDYDDDGECVDSMDAIEGGVGYRESNSDQGGNKLPDKFDKMIRVYSSLQKRTQEKVSAVLTYKMCESMQKEHLELLLKYDFINSGIVEQFLIDGKALSQKELANLMGIKEESLSRTMSEFYAKVEENEK